VSKREILLELFGPEEFRRMIRDVEYGRISTITCVEIVRDENEEKVERSEI